MLYLLDKDLKTAILAQAGVAQWIECWPVNQRATGSIPSRHMLGVRARSPVGRGHAKGNHTLIRSSLPPFPSV